MKFGDAEITGLACFHVDDFIITDGGSSFERNFKLVKDLYEWGDWEKDEFNLTGMTIARTKHAIEVEQSEKIFAVDCIKIHEEHLRAGKDKAVVAGHSAFRAVVGSLHYIAAHTGPDLAASVPYYRGLQKVHKFFTSRKQIRC